MGTPDLAAQQAGRQRAFVFVERLWSPVARQLLGSKEEAIDYFTRELLRLDEFYQGVVVAVDEDQHA